MRILIADSIAKEGIEKIRKAGFSVDEKIGLSEDELVKIIPEYDAIVVRSATKVTRKIIEAGVKLKLIGRAGVGLDNVDQVSAKEKNIKVVNTPAATSISVAELAFGLMLAMARRITESDATMKKGKWEKKRLGEMGLELYGKTLGIIGIGRIGQEVAKRALAFGMNVIAYDAYLTVSPVKEVPLVSFDELLSKSDFITLHIPLDKEKGAVLTAEEFKKMKDGVYLVNCARGGVVDESALLDALNSGKVAMAGIDVYAKEPTDNTALVNHPNTICLPHLGASTEEGQVRAGIQIADLVIENLK